MCSNYSEKNIQGLVNLLFSDDHQASVETWHPILVLVRFYSQDNLIHLIVYLFDIKNSTGELIATTLTGENAFMLLCKYSKSRKITWIAQLLITRRIEIDQVDQLDQVVIMLSSCCISKIYYITMKTKFFLNWQTCYSFPTDLISIRSIFSVTQHWALILIYTNNCRAIWSSK